jgi:undecaprenyl-diphosphatase
MEVNGMIGYIISLDQVLFHLVNGVWVSPPLDRLMPALSAAGNAGVIWLGLLGALAVLGGKTGRKMALAGLIALAIGFVTSGLLKEITMLPRPFATLPDVRLLVPEPRSYALPSGHATSAFAAASGAVLAAKRLLGRVPAWGWGMLALATAIAYSRIYVGVHWPTDVAAGILLGMACGWIGSRLARRREKSGRPDRPEETESSREEVSEVKYQV